MKQLDFRVTGLSEEDLRRWRQSARGSRLLLSPVLAGIVLISFLYASGGFRAIAVSALTGECGGSIIAAPTQGYAGEPQQVMVKIDPPFHAVITRVVTDNPACRNCAARARAPGEFAFSGSFTGSGPYRIEFIALDQQGQIRCRGFTDELLALGARP